MSTVSYTDLCVIDVTPEGMKVIEKVEGLSFEELQSMTGAKLIDATQSNLRGSSSFIKGGT